MGELKGLNNPTVNLNVLSSNIESTSRMPFRKLCVYRNTSAGKIRLWGFYDAGGPTSGLPPFELDANKEIYIDSRLQINDTNKGLTQNYQKIPLHYSQLFKDLIKLIQL